LLLGPLPNETQIQHQQRPDLCVVLLRSILSIYKGPQ
jgi:hypothetical protein